VLISQMDKPQKFQYAITGSFFLTAYVIFSDFKRLTSLYVSLHHKNGRTNRRTKFMLCWRVAYYQELSCCRGTARRSATAEILSIKLMQNYTKKRIW